MDCVVRKIGLIGRIGPMEKESESVVDCRLKCSECGKDYTIENPSCEGIERLTMVSELGIPMLCDECYKKAVADWLGDKTVSVFAKA